MYEKYIFINILWKITSTTITKYSSWTQMFMICRQIEWNTKNTTVGSEPQNHWNMQDRYLRPVAFLVWYRYFNKTWRVKASFMGKHLLQMDSYCLTSHLFYCFNFSSVDRETQHRPASHWQTFIKRDLYQVHLTTIGNETLCFDWID